MLYSSPDEAIHFSQVVAPPYGGYAWSGGHTYNSMGVGFLFGCKASMCWQRSDGTLELSLNAFDYMAKHAYISTGEAFFIYLDEAFTLSDFHYLGGKWVPGMLNSLGIKMDWYANMTSTSWYDTPSKTMCGRIYFQEAGQTTMKELCWDSNSQKWYPGAVLVDSMKGTGIAAIAVLNAAGQALGIGSVFYQSTDYVIRSYCWTTAGWHQDTSVQWTDAAPATGIAVALPASSTSPNVFYTGSSAGKPLCQRVYTPSAWTLNQQPMPVARMNNVLAAVATEATSGCAFRVYCQDTLGRVVELGQAPFSTTWTSSLVASATP